MKKILFYIPAILFSLLYGWLAISLGLSSISPFVLLWMIAFLAAGILLSRDKFYGGLFGMLPGLHLIYMSTQDTGQVINIELPSGIIILLFYLLCGGIVFYMQKKKVV